MSWIFALLGVLVSAIGLGVQAKQTRETNEANLAAVDKTNQANAEQAELAYKRSLPTRQVANMMAAGMSKSAALQSLAGGGSYSAPVMQSAQMQSPNLDFAALAERIGGIPSNAQQSAMIKQQLESMRLDNDIKREQLELAKAQAAREATIQTGDFEARQYDRETAKQTDALRAIINRRAAEFKINLNDIKSEQELIDKLKLNDVAEWTNARASSRDNVLAYLGVTNSMRNENRAADIDFLIKNRDLSEREQTFMRRLEILANQVKQGNLQIDKENYEKILRDVGFQNKKEAAEAIALAENLKAMEERDQARFYGSRAETAKKIIWTLDRCIDAVTPFKGLLGK